MNVYLYALMVYLAAAAISFLVVGLIVGINALMNRNTKKGDTGNG